MDERALQIEQLIAAARADSGMLGPLLEAYRPFLLSMAQHRIGPRLAVRCEPSDAVQQTFLDVQRGFGTFCGVGEPEFSAWIKRIHDHNLNDLVRRHVATGSRSLLHEVQPRPDPEASVSFVWNDPVAEQTTPSQHVVRSERALRLAAVLQSLPEQQSEAVRLRHIEGWPIDRIAKELDRSLAATAGLIKRGLQTLRVRMTMDSWF